MKLVIFLFSFFISFYLTEKLESNIQANRYNLQEQNNNVVYPSVGQEQQTRFISVNDGLRLTTDDPEVIQIWIEQIKQSKGFNIVFLGDSIIYGDGTTDEKKTIPSLLKQKLAEKEAGQVINVFNLTLPSAGPAEVYLIARELVKAKVDLLIYDLNIGWLDRDEILEHPVLLRLGDNKNLNPADFKVENLNQLAPNYYNIYDEDDNLRELVTSWTQKNWQGILDSQDMGKFGQIQLKCSQQWVYVQKTVALFQEHHIKALFFANPRNFKLLDEYDLIDYQSYHETLRTIFNYLDNSGIVSVNLDGVVPSEHFSDLVHLLPEGEEAAAGNLCDFVVQSGLVAVDN